MNTKFLEAVFFTPKIKNQIRKTKSIMLTNEQDSAYIWNVVNFANDLAAAIILPSNEEQGEASEIALGTFFTAITNKTNNVTDEMLAKVWTGKNKVHYSRMESECFQYV